MVMVALGFALGTALGIYAGKRSAAGLGWRAICSELIDDIDYFAQRARTMICDIVKKFRKS